jgi:hypothetical protein
MIMPINTNSTIAPCSQIQVGDISQRIFADGDRERHSASWNSAATVNTRIFTSRPSDQWAM